MKDILKICTTMHIIPLIHKLAITGIIYHTDSSFGATYAQDVMTLPFCKWAYLAHTYFCVLGTL